MAAQKQHHSLIINEPIKFDRELSKIKSKQTFEGPALLSDPSQALSLPLGNQSLAANRRASAINQEGGNPSSQGGSVLTNIYQKRRSSFMVPGMGLNLQGASSLSAVAAAASLIRKNKQQTAGFGIQGGGTSTNIAVESLGPTNILHGKKALEVSKSNQIRTAFA